MTADQGIRDEQRRYFRRLMYAVLIDIAAFAALVAARSVG
jgi:hypothetical protein